MSQLSAEELTMAKSISTEFETLTARRIPWLKPETFVKCMLPVATKIVDERASVHQVLVCSPCDYTRNTVANNFVTSVFAALGGQHIKVGFGKMVRKDPDVTNAESIDDIVNFHESEDGKSVTICEIPNAHEYSDETFMSGVCKLTETFLLRGRSVVLLASGDFGRKEISQLSELYNRKHPEPFRPFDEWYTDHACAILTQGSLQKMVFADVWAFPGPTPRTTAVAYIALLQNSLETELGRDIGLRMAVNSALALSQEFSSVSAFSKFAQRVALMARHEDCDGKLEMVIVELSDQELKFTAGIKIFMTYPVLGRLQITPSAPIELTNPAPASVVPKRTRNRKANGGIYFRYNKSGEHIGYHIKHKKQGKWRKDYLSKVIETDDGFQVMNTRQLKIAVRRFGLSDETIQTSLRRLNLIAD